MQEFEAVDENDRQQILNSLSKVMDERVRTQELLSQAAREFSNRLFAALEHVLDDIATLGIPGIGKHRRLVHPAGGGVEGLQIFIEDWSIIFVPLLGVARPNTADEARIPPVQFKEPCARIAVFLTDTPQGSSFYDFLIFQDHSWFAWGYGWPKQQSDIESTDFEGLALELVDSFAKDIFVTWHPRDDTILSSALDTKKRCFAFGLPGEDLQLTAG